MKKISLSVAALLVVIGLVGCKGQKAPTTYQECTNNCSNKYFNSSYEKYMKCKQGCELLRNNLDSELSNSPY